MTAPHPAGGHPGYRDRIVRTAPNVVTATDWTARDFCERTPEVLAPLVAALITGSIGGAQR